MGSAASTAAGLPERLNEALCRELMGDRFDDAAFALLEKDSAGTVGREAALAAAGVEGESQGSTRARGYPCPYGPRPSAADGRGSLVWVNGGTASGKSAIGACLKASADWAWYEGDCFLFHLNPYTDRAPNGSVGGGEASTPLAPERLEGIPPATVAACARALEGFERVAAGAGSSVEDAVWEAFYTALCADVLAERARLGPGWNLAVGGAVLTRASRDLVRRLLGPALRFVVIDIEAGLQAERLRERYGLPAEAHGALEGRCRAEAAFLAPTALDGATGGLVLAEGVVNAEGGINAEWGNPEGGEAAMLRLKALRGRSAAELAEEVRAFVAEPGGAAAATAGGREGGGEATASAAPAAAAAASSAPPPMGLRRKLTKRQTSNEFEMELKRDLENEEDDEDYEDDNDELLKGRKLGRVTEE